MKYWPVVLLALFSLTNLQAEYYGTHTPLRPTIDSLAGNAEWEELLKKINSICEPNPRLPIDPQGFARPPQAITPGLPALPQTPSAANAGAGQGNSAAPTENDFEKAFYARLTQWLRQRRGRSAAELLNEAERTLERVSKD